MRKKVLLLGLCSLLADLSFSQTAYELHLGGMSQVEQYDLQHVGTNRIQAGTAVNEQQQYVVWYAKTTESNQLVWIKSFPLAVNNTGSTSFNALNNIVDVESCNLSDNFMLTVKRIDTATSNMYIDVLKLTANGELNWGKRVTFTESENAFAVYQSNRMIILPNDEVIVSNGHKNGISLCKLSPQGVRLASHHLSVSQEIVEDYNNGGWTLTTAVNGGFFASFQKDEHPVLVRLDSQFNTLWTKEWSSQQQAITAIRDLGGDYMFGGLGVGGDFFGYSSEDLGSTSLCQVSQGGYSGFYNLDIYEPGSGKFFAETNQSYKIIQISSGTYTRHAISNSFSDFGTHYRLNGNSPNPTATYFTRISNPATVPYIEAFALEDPACVHHTATEYPIVPIVIPANSILAPTIYKQDNGAFTNYAPTIGTALGSMSESCFYVGTEENAWKNMAVYPNPVAAGQTLHFEGITGMENGTIVLTDVQGKIVAEYPFSEQITLPAIHSGVYFVTVAEQNGNRTSTKKIIVQ